MKLTLSISAFLLALFLISCSNSSNPISPSDYSRSNNDEITQSTTENNISEEDIQHSNRNVLGAWEVRIDTKNLTYEIIPSRNARAIGDIFDADLSQFLTVAPCANCLMIGGLYFDGYENFNLIVSMKHPFGNITTRPDLHGFDVRGIFIIPSRVSWASINMMKPDGMEESIEHSDTILNPDGYTSHYDELVNDTRYFQNGTDVTGNLNPFLRFFESYSMPVFDPHSPSGYNVMPVGSGIYSRTAVFDTEDIYDVFTIFIVADVAYGQSAVLANRTNPQYYLPSFNRTEPWRVEYYLENNGLSDSLPSSSVDVIAQVFDWQHGATVDPNYPDPSNLSGIPEKSDVFKLELYVPDLQDDVVIATVPEAGTGIPSDPLKYRLNIKNVKNRAVEAKGILAVRDDIYGQTAPNGRLPVPASPSGFPYETTDILDYAIYVPIYINIPYNLFVFGPGSWFGKYECMIPWDDQFANWHYSGVSKTTIHPEFFMDPSHKKFQYRWDYDYDGVTFDIDGGGLPSPEISYPTAGKKTVGLRIRTNTVPPKEHLYSIPVYAEGIAYEKIIPSMMNVRDTTSSMRGHSVAATSQYFYAAYSHEEGSTRNIWLAIFDRYGNTSTHQVTNSSKICYNPVILVLESGPHEGVYIVYSEYDGASNLLYSIYGNTDGSGFDPSHIKRVTTNTPGSAVEFQPCLILFNGKLCVYYSFYQLFFSYIYGSHSDDYGLTWNDDGWIVNNTSTGQISPTASVGYTDVYLVWADFINSVNLGADLHTAKSSDGFSFTNIKNISSFNDKTDETDPSSTRHANQLAIAYLARPDGSSVETVRFKVMSTYYDSMFDKKLTIATGGNLTHTQPCVRTVGVGRYTVSYGSYDTVSKNLDAIISELQVGSDPSILYENYIYQESVGTVDSANFGSELYPGIACYNPLANTTENFIVFRDYTTGSFQSPNTPIEVFGNIKAMYFVTEREYWVF